MQPEERTSRSHQSNARCLLCFATAFSLLLLPAISFAQFDFATNNGTLTITRYTGEDGNVIIPSYTNGLPVVSIGNEAFDKTTIAASVFIPNSVTSIGDYAFYWSSWTNVIIPNSVTNIGIGAFDDSDIISITFLQQFYQPTRRESAGFVLASPA